MDRTLKGTTTLGQSESVNNGNEVLTPYNLELQNWSLTIGCSLVLYPGYTFFLRGELVLSSYKKCNRHILDPTDMMV